MSIENQIEKLTEAVTALNVTISSLVNEMNFGKTSVSGANGSTGSETAEAPKAETAPKKTKGTKAKPEPTPEPEPEVEDLDDGLGLDDDEPAEAVTFDQLKAVVSEVSKKKGRETILKLFKNFGVSTFTEVKAEQYSEMFKAANELLGK